MTYNLGTYGKKKNKNKKIKEDRKKRSATDPRLSGGRRVRIRIQVLKTNTFI